MVMVWSWCSFVGICILLWEFCFTVSYQWWSEMMTFRLSAWNHQMICICWTWYRRGVDIAVRARDWWGRFVTICNPELGWQFQWLSFQEWVPTTDLSTVWLQAFCLLINLPLNNLEISNHSRLLNLSIIMSSLPICLRHNSNELCEIAHFRKSFDCC
jgi:hypothetical protein